MSDFLKIYNKYSDELFSFLLGRVRDENIAEDLLSEVFLKAIRFAEGGGKVTHERGLLYKIARNCLTDFYRTQGRTVPIQEENEREEEGVKKEFIDPLPLVTEQIDKEFTSLEIKQLLSRLPKESQEIITLRYFEQLEIEEIAEILEKSEGAVRVQLHRVISALRDIFPHHNND